MARRVKPYPCGLFVMKMGGFRLPVSGEKSRDGEASRELVLDPPGELMGGGAISVQEIAFIKI